HQYIYLAEPFDYRFDAGVTLLFEANVDHHRFHPYLMPLQLLARLAQAVTIGLRQYPLRTVAGQGIGHGETDTAARSGDDRDLAGQVRSNRHDQLPLPSGALSDAPAIAPRPSSPHR